MQIQGLGSLKNDNRMNRLAMIFCVLLSVGSSMFFYVDSRNFINDRSEKKVVIDKQNRAWLATERGLTEEERMIQAQEQVTDFYKLFFAFDANTFDSTVNRALNLMEASAGKSLYLKEYVEGKMARKVKEGNWKVKVDNIKFEPEEGVYPIRGKVFAVQTVVRSAGEVKRRLYATYTVITTSVSLENPRGYLITQFDLFDTSLIKNAKK